MNIFDQSLRKEERLSSKKKIDLLYEQGQSFVSFPLRIIYLTEKNTDKPGVCTLMCIPKKKIKKAVKRNYIKRQIREAYRVRKHVLTNLMVEKEHTLLLSFLYLDKITNSFHDIETAMDKALTILLNKV
jgi:ribonuclease P protein component